MKSAMTSHSLSQLQYLTLVRFSQHLGRAEQANGSSMVEALRQGHQDEQVQLLGEAPVVDLQ